MDCDEKTDPYEPSLTGQQRVHIRCERFIADWRRSLEETGDNSPEMREYLVDAIGDERSALFAELLDIDLNFRRKKGDSPQQQDYGQFPEFTDLIIKAFHIGHYRILDVLASGAYGSVYRALDTKLERQVAIKVLHTSRVGQPDDYLREARILAQLDHPNIVPIYDCGRTTDGSCFLVYKLIAGVNLRDRLAMTRPGFDETARLMMTLANCLHYAHQQGLVHRDIKPANILIDKEGTLHLTDFGLALRDIDFGDPSRQGGTPAYMSPEQARGEGHRVDPRSDIFSLGVVFYELLVGQRPFHGSSPREVIDQIKSPELDAQSPRGYSPELPLELERICMKCLAKPRGARYPHAQALAEDLAHYLGRSATMAARPNESRQRREIHTSRIVFKGLRAFDHDDAEFFLELVPGPLHPRDGLPESIHFWKTKIEATSSENSFSVGLIYGPSGCGKSSLVKAGLLPRLAEHVIPIYVEATPDRTETRMVVGLEKHCRFVTENLSLVERLSALRRGHGLSSGKKVLIVLDQFEQWLYAHRDDERPDLVEALRQCDGQHVQCVVMVRDDFWMAITRFLRNLEMPLLEGVNSNVVDLFPVRHAQDVLAKFGRAFGALPHEPPAAAQEDFVRQSIEGLAEEGKVVCIRLALFAEMMKDKPWTLATLLAMGGIQGVGVMFLDKTFSATTAPPEHRYHQKAARAVLKALLPESGTEIRGHMRPLDELLVVSGYARGSSDFDELIHILDHQLRLITPVDPIGHQVDGWTKNVDRPFSLHYQLTHDYLVPSLREWLSRKQKETHRGRAELRLAERAAQWNAEPVNRYLPKSWEHLNIRLFTDTKTWTEPQRKMMRQSSRFHGVRALIGVSFILLSVTTGLWIRERATAVSLVANVMKADIANLPGIVAELIHYRKWIDPQLKTEYAKTTNPDEKLRLALALLPVDETQVSYLHECLLAALPSELPVLIRSLSDHRTKLIEPLWNKLKDTKSPTDTRLRAASALAEYDSGSARWDESCDDVAAMLVAVNPADIGVWKEALRPVHAALLDPLTKIFRDASRPPLERSLATSLLADYAAADVGRLATLISESDAEQFVVLFPVLKRHGKEAISHLESILDRVPMLKWNDPPLNPSWPTADAADVRTIEAAQGLIAERFAFCQAMPLQQFQSAAENLAKSGYRPVRFCPFSTTGEVLIAAIWTRDGVEFQCEPGTSAEGIREKGKELKSQGYIPVDVSGYLMTDRDDSAGKVTPRYSALWAKAGTDEIEAQAYVGVTLEKDRQHAETLGQKGFNRTSNIVLRDTNGAELCSAVWTKNTRESEPDYEIFPESPVHDVSPEIKRQRAVQWIADGYRPAAILGPETKENASLMSTLVWHRPLLGTLESVKMGENRAGTAIALLRMGMRNEFLAALRVRDDPEVLTQFVHRCRAQHVTAAELLDCLQRADQLRQTKSGEDRKIEDRVLYGLLLAFGEYRPEDLSLGERNSLILRLVDWYTRDLNSGIHGATGWLLRHWGFAEQARKVDQTPVEYAPGREWFTLEIKPTFDVSSTNREIQSSEQSFYLTFVVFEPGAYLIGSPSDEPDRESDEVRHVVRITRPFAILDREITRAEVAAYGLWFAGGIERTSPSPAHPMGGPCWYDVVRFCRWLGAQVGLPEDEQPYPDANSLDASTYAADQHPDADGAPQAWPVRLDRSGFRLPTEAEWEIACRGGMRTMYGFGGDVTLLDRYGWFDGNSEQHGHLPRSLRPNMRGIFDMHGNVWEWCHDWQVDYASMEVNDPVGPSHGWNRVYRGGSWDHAWRFCRSAIRGRGHPTYRTSYIGFRVAAVPTLPARPREAAAEPRAKERKPIAPQGTSRRSS